MYVCTEKFVDKESLRKPITELDYLFSMIYDCSFLFSQTVPKQLISLL